jgi:predicted ferric reductase
MVNQQIDHQLEQPGAAPARNGLRRATAPQATPQDDLEDVLLTIAPYYVLLLVILAAAGGAILLAMAQPAWLSAVGASLGGPEPKAYWYLSRSSALVAYTLLWSSMALGLAITNKLARVWPGGPTITALHEHTGLLGLAFGLFHALILLGDRYTNYTAAQVLVPFGSANYRPLWVGLGQIGLYLLLLVGLSFYARRWIGYRAWRLIHYLSFAAFVLTLVHGLASGTDSAAVWARDLYWASVVSLASLTLYRLAIA